MEESDFVIMGKAYVKMFLFKQGGLMKVSIFVMVLLVMFGCASRPILYTGDNLERVDREEIQEDVALCEDEADSFLNSSQSRNDEKVIEIDRETKTAGAISSILRGDPTPSIFSQQEVVSQDANRVIKRGIITQCLAQRGHTVIGFD